MHGIGLYVFRWEDLPEEVVEEEPKVEVKPDFTEANFEAFKKNTSYDDYTIWKEVIEKKYKLTLWMAKKVKDHYTSKDTGIDLDITVPF